MTPKKKICCVVGTRPEAIKMAPVILGLHECSDVEVTVLATGQHRGMLDQVLDFFGITPDFDFNVMQRNQTLSVLTARLLPKMEEFLIEHKPDIVIVQGDTTTVITIAMACFYQGIDVAHVEAGLRTGDIKNPFPEEFNRVVTSKIAKWHFAPTDQSKDNLLKEGVPDSDIIMSGNTVIDALLSTAEKDIDFGIEIDAGKRMILVTSHRRENFGAPFARICSSLKKLALANPDVQFVYPVHPNPHVKDLAHATFDPIDNFLLCEPLDYPAFVAAMKRSYFVITDSGGVQEEAPALGKPVLVLREETERPEAVDFGVVTLVGSDEDKIIQTAQRLLDDEDFFKSMAIGVSPYGDGKSAGRIVKTLVSGQ